MPKTFIPSFADTAPTAGVSAGGAQMDGTARLWRCASITVAFMDQAGLGPSDIQSLEDIRKLPFTTADDLRAGYPFPLLSVPMSDVVRIHASSGPRANAKFSPIRKRT